MRRGEETKGRDERERREDEARAIGESKRREQEARRHDQRKLYRELTRSRDSETSAIDLEPNIRQLRRSREHITPLRPRHLGPLYLGVDRFDRRVLEEKQRRPRIRNGRRAPRRRHAVDRDRLRGELPEPIRVIDADCRKTRCQGNCSVDVAKGVEGVGGGARSCCAICAASGFGEVAGEQRLLDE